MNYRDIEWTETDVETLKKMLADGSSFNQIGKALGRTRCMISGKVHRMKLTYVGRGMHNPQEKEKKERDIKVAQLYKDGLSESYIAFTVGIDRETVHRSLVRSGNKQKRIKGVKKVKERNGNIKPWRSVHYENTIEQPVKLVSLFDLEPHHCRFPHGDPGKNGFGFCGAEKVDESPYCAHHSRIAYREPINITEHERKRRSRLGRMQVSSGAWSCGFNVRRAENGV